MPVSLIGMPRFQGNSQGYNFRPVVQAAESWRAQNNQNAMMQQRQQQFETGMDQRYDAMDDRQEQANAMLQARNKQQGLDNEFRNKQFGATQDYRKQQLAQNQASAGARGAELELKRQRLMLEIQRMKKGNPLRDMKVRLLQQLMPDAMGAPGGQPAQPGSDPNLQLQSFQGQPAQPGQPTIQFLPQAGGPQPEPDPNIRLAQTAQPGAQPGQAQPQSPLSSLSPAARQGMALNMVSPGLGTPLLAQAAQEQFGKTAKGMLDKKIIGVSDSIANLDRIQSTFDPEFLTAAGGLKANYIEMVDKFRIGGMKPNQKQQEYLSKYAKFKQDASQFVNDYIRQQTGAVMSVAETKRLMQDVPNPGDSWWNGDSPGRFKSKFDNASAKIRLAAARYTYLRSARFMATNGGKPGKISQMSFGKMRSVINKRAQEISTEVRRANPRMDASLIQSEADAMLRKEFGI